MRRGVRFVLRFSNYLQGRCTVTLSEQKFMRLHSRILIRVVKYGVSIGIFGRYRGLRTIIRTFTHTNFAWECLMSRCIRNLARIGHRVKHIVAFEIRLKYRFRRHPRTFAKQCERCKHVKTSLRDKCVRANLRRTTNIV